MVDINPLSQIQQYTPKQSDLVDAIAESKRVIDAQIRSNPLRNATIDDGLMRWKGNYYAPGLDTYLWIGEFFPRDAVLDKPQRGFILRRDDPKHARVLQMYDSFAASANPVNQPLRQLVTMNDADDRRIIDEGRYGGLRFPWSAIPLYPLVLDYWEYGTPDGSPTSNQFVPTISAIVATEAGEVTNLFQGIGAMTGSRLRIYGKGAVVGAGVALGIHVTLSFSNGVNYTSSRTDIYSGTVFWDFDLDFEGTTVVGEIVQVKLYGSGIGTASQWSWLHPLWCYSYSR